jgi:hypothetical protein
MVGDPLAPARIPRNRIQVGTLIRIVDQITGLGAGLIIHST